MSNADLVALRHAVERTTHGIWKDDAVVNSTVVLDLLDTIDKQRLALSRGWTLAQYEYADSHDEWAENAGDGTADGRWIR